MCVHISILSNERIFICPAPNRMPFDQSTTLGFWLSYAVEYAGMTVGTLIIGTVITLFFGVCFYLMACIGVLQSIFEQIDALVVGNPPYADKSISKYLIAIIELHTNVDW